MSATKISAGYEIAGYRVIESIGEGARGHVYKVSKNGQFYALKILKEASGIEEADRKVRFHKETATFARCTHPHLARILDFGEFAGILYLVMELAEGQTLSERAKASLSKEDIVHLAVCLSGALEEIHRHGLVHRDIKPENIILSQKGEVKLIDFGLGGDLDDVESSAARNEIVGTIFYAAPEQLGILKRSVDARADLYSLGVVLYESLVGEPPYVSSDLNAFASLLASSNSPDIRKKKPDASPIFSQIIEKLLKKNPDERYQTALGLKYDLENLSFLEDQLRLGQPTVLGKQDFSGIGQYRLPLFGRDRELQSLKEHLEKCRASRGRSVLIAGEGGLGKSRLTREIVREAEGMRIQVLAAKCNPLESENPLAPLRHALDQFILKVHQLPDIERAKAIENILSAAGDTSLVIANLSDGLRKLLKTPLLGSQGVDRSSFIRLAGQFFCRLSELNSGLVLLVDDIQWIDDLSLDLLCEIGRQQANSPLFLITTARNDQASQKALEQFKKSFGKNLHEEFPIRPLSGPACEGLIRSYLGDRDVEPAITEKMVSLSRGNPFYLIEYLGKLLSAGCLQIQNGRWVLDNESLSKVQLSDNIYDLILSRFQTLPVESRNIASVASIVGFHFNSRFVARVLNISDSNARDALVAAIRASVIEMDGDTDYRFIHDRVREAIVANLDSRTIRDINDQVASFLETEIAENPSSIFDLARYSAHGNTERHPSRVFRYNAAAGSLAHSNFARRQAFEFFTKAQEFEGKCEIENHLRVDFSMNFGSNCVDLGYVERGIELLEKALSMAENDTQKASIYLLRSSAFMHQGQLLKAWEAGQKALAIFGHQIPQNKGKIIWSLIRTLRANYLGLPWERKLAQERSGLDRNWIKLLADIYERQASVAFFMGKKIELLYLGFLQFYYASLLGDSPELVRAHSYVGIAYSIMRIAKAVNYHLKEALDISDRLNNRIAQIIAKYNAVFAIEFIGEVVRAEKMGLEIIKDVEMKLSAYDITLCASDQVTQYLLRGYHRESVEKAFKYLPLMDELNRCMGQCAIRAHMFCQMIILGRTAEAAEIYKGLVKLAAPVDREVKFVWAKIPAVQLVAAFETEDFGPEIEKYIQEFKEQKFDNIQHKLFYAWVGYIRLEQAERASNPGEKRAALRNLKVELSFMKRSFRTSVSRCHYFILWAAHQRLCGEMKNCKAYLDKAENLAKDSDSIFGKFMIYKERARLARALGQESESKAFAMLALEMAQKHSWPFRAEQIAREFDIQPMSSVGSENDASDGQGAITRPSHALENDRRIINSLLKVSLASALEMDPRRQIQFSLDEIVKILGAERGYIFLWDDESRTLEFKAGRDQNQKDLEKPTGYSSTVIKKVLDDKEPVVLTGSDQMEAIGSQSAVIQGLRSIMAVPLVLKAQFKGVVYVDSSVAKGLFSKPDIEILVAISNHIAIAFENMKMMNAEASRREMQKDLEVSAAVQQMLLPKISHDLQERFEIAGFYRSAVQCGGDWWWYESKGSNKLRAFVGDVTGHGAGPAMITSYVAACFDMSLAINEKLEFSELLQKTSRLLFQMTNMNFLMSSVAMEINFETRMMKCWNAGGPGFMILRTNGEVEWVLSAGTFIGMEDFSVELTEVQIQSGDRIFIPTDGILEMTLPNGTQFGSRSTRKLLQKTKGLSATEAVKSMIGELDQARQNVPQDDDLTMLIIDIK